MKLWYHIFRAFLNRYIKAFIWIYRKVCDTIDFIAFLKKIRIKNVEYYILLPKIDYGITNELLFFNIREKEAADFYIEFLTQNKKNIEHIIEIGANIGYYLLIAEKVLKNKKIWAFEPIERNFYFLQKNIAINEPLQNEIFLFKEAVSYYSGKANMFVPHQGNWASLYDLENIKSEKEEVNTIKLSSFLKEKNIFRNFLIRMDIEGFEYDLFTKDFIKNLKEFSNYFIFMEFHPHIIGKEKSLDFLTKLEKHFTLIKVMYLPSIYYSFFKKDSTLYKLHNWFNNKLDNSYKEFYSFQEIKDFINKGNLYGLMLFLKSRDN